LQIKPVNVGIQLAEIHKEYSIQLDTHKKFSKKFGGTVFYIFSEKIDNKKKIKNTEVVAEIQQEIERLQLIN
jgi:hypothetical protein